MKSAMICWVREAAVYTPAVSNTRVSGCSEINKQPERFETLSSGKPRTEEKGDGKFLQVDSDVIIQTDY